MPTHTPLQAGFRHALARSLPAAWSSWSGVADPYGLASAFLAGQRSAMR